jgi:hypothetical protein
MESATARRPSETCEVCAGSGQRMVGMSVRAGEGSSTIVIEITEPCTCTR